MRSNILYVVSWRGLIAERHARSVGVAIVKIDPDIVCVYFSRPAVLEDTRRYSQMMSTLSDDEVRRAGRFHFEHDRRLFVASRALVRRALSRYLNVEPAAWRFETNSYGQPHIVSPVEGKMLRFSASHTDGLVMCVVANNRDVGGDVERLRACPLDVVDCFFAPVEAKAIWALSGKERLERFLTYWTLKESYVKARGLGFSIPPNRFAFHLNDYPFPRIEIDPALDRRASGWRFYFLRPTLTHRASLCVYLPDQPMLCISQFGFASDQAGLDREVFHATTSATRQFGPYEQVIGDIGDADWVDLRIHLETISTRQAGANHSDYSVVM